MAISPRGGSSDPLHVWFYVGFLGSADRMALFPVWPNSKGMSRRLPTDSAMRTHNVAVGRDPVYNAANGSRLPTGVFTPATRRNCRQLVANSCTHRRRDATRQFRLVGVGGVYWAL